MSVTLKLLDVTDEKGRPLYRLVEDYWYCLGPGVTIKVPAGYVTNFGTIPRLFWRIVSPAELREASIVHDFMCNESLDGSVIDSGYSRWLADAVLYEAMARLGFGWFRRSFVYAGVRFWAWVSGNTEFPDPPNLECEKW